MTNPRRHFVLIDGSNMLHRAWAMGGTRPRPSDGRETGAVNLFGAMVMKLMRRMSQGRFPPTHGAIFFDPGRADSWRREVSVDYKAHRPETDPALKVQIEMMKDMVGAMGIAQTTAPKHEADDLIAAYAEDAFEAGDRATIVSSDKDLMWLVRNKGVLMLDEVRKRWFNTADVEEKFGVRAEQILDYLALAGDSSDGVPGAPGIGPKAAQALLAEFGSVSELLRRAEEIERKGWKKIVLENKDAIRLSRLLVTLDVSGAPRPLTVASMAMPTPVEAYRGLEKWREQNLS